MEAAYPSKTLAQSQNTTCAATQMIIEMGALIVQKTQSTITVLPRHTCLDFLNFLLSIQLPARRDEWKSSFFYKRVVNREEGKKLCVVSSPYQPFRGFRFHIKTI
jgi:hypothetical protein